MKIKKVSGASIGLFIYRDTQAFMKKYSIIQLIITHN